MGEAQGEQVYARKQNSLFIFVNISRTSLSKPSCFPEHAIRIDLPENLRADSGRRGRHSRAFVKMPNMLKQLRYEDIGTEVLKLG